MIEEKGQETDAQHVLVVRGNHMREYVGEFEDVSFVEAAANHKICFGQIFAQYFPEISNFSHSKQNGITQQVI